MAKDHQNVELAMDFSFFYGSHFLHTKSRKIDFSSVQAYNNRGRSENISGLNQGKTKYKYRGFTITYYHGDNEFEHLCNFLALAHLHTYTANEHIGDIERFIRKIKERVVCRCHSIPYNKFTKLMTISLVQDMIIFLNMFPSKKGIASDLIPLAIILGSPNPYYNKLKIIF